MERHDEVASLSLPLGRTSLSMTLGAGVLLSRYPLVSASMCWIFIAALLYSGRPPSPVLVSIRSPKYCGKMQSEG